MLKVVGKSRHIFVGKSQGKLREDFVLFRGLRDLIINHRSTSNDLFGS